MNSQNSIFAKRIINKTIILDKPILKVCAFSVGIVDFRPPSSFRRLLYTMQTRYFGQTSNTLLQCDLCKQYSQRTLIGKEHTIRPQPLCGLCTSGEFSRTPI